MDKKLLERLILVEDNLRDIEGDLISISGKFPHIVDTELVCKFGMELDCLGALIDFLKEQEVENVNPNKS